MGLREQPASMEARPGGEIKRDADDSAVKSAIVMNCGIYDGHLFSPEKSSRTNGARGRRSQHRQKRRKSQIKF